MANYLHNHDTHARSVQYGNISPTRTHVRLPAPRRPSTQKEVKRVDEGDLVLGRLFWLPPKEELPPRAVRRAHGKGAVEEGIYNHPIVVISRPADESQVVHFHIVTSFQGKRLHEIYSKGNEFHASRRSWYLPISPSPPHPDATSKKLQKRFPTLDLADNATLRWDSYVNIRHVYKIEWAHLRSYSNPDTPATHIFRFDRESCDKMMAKTKLLANYEAGTQHQTRYQTTRAATSLLPLRIPETPTRTRRQPVSNEQGEREEMLHSPRSISDSGSVIGSEYSGLSPILQSDFGGGRFESEQSVPMPKKAPPDGGEVVLERLWRLVMVMLLWPLAMLRRMREKSKR